VARQLGIEGKNKSELVERITKEQQRLKLKAGLLNPSEQNAYKRNHPSSERTNFEDKPIPAVSKEREAYIDTLITLSEHSGFSRQSLDEIFKENSNYGGEVPFYKIWQSPADLQNALPTLEKLEDERKIDLHVANDPNDVLHPEFATQIGDRKGVYYISLRKRAG
jgi:hypothetical protein